MRIQRPSPSLVISCIALFVALGGVGYAAATGSIDGREIKNNSVASRDARNNSLTGRDVKTSGLTGSDVKANSLTGSDVNESGLGKVPRAAAADSAGTAASAATATNAGNANTVGGQRVVPFSYRSDATAAETTVASVGGMRLAGTCVGGTSDLSLFNVAGTSAEVSVTLVGPSNQTSGSEVTVSNNDNTNLGLGALYAVRSGQAAFHTQAGRPVRILFTLNEGVFGFDCSISGVAIG